MISKANKKSIGREPSCDLVLEHPGTSRFHASLELADNGLISVIDSDSGNGTFLNRNDQWIQIRRITLCIGDRVRFGESEIPLQGLTALFGQHTNARLEARHFSLQDGNNAARPFTKLTDSAAVLKKPVRNPVTGKIEERDN
jgi:pSer/pThr/pTyr-binding forkhead associated (FHA) protein